MSSYPHNQSYDYNWSTPSYYNYNQTPTVSPTQSYYYNSQPYTQLSNQHQLSYNSSGYASDLFSSGNSPQNNINYASTYGSNNNNLSFQSPASSSFYVPPLLQLNNKVRN